jgi:hypothetical protein
MSKKRILIAAMIGIFGFTGIAAGCSSKSDDSAVRSEQSTTQKADTVDTTAGASDLRAGMTQLLGQHLDLASAATRAGYDGRAEDFAASAKSLDNNSVALSKAIGSVYGADAESSFLAIWRSHIGFFVDYTTAAKKGDKAGMDTAVRNLNGYVESISELLSKANPNLPKQALVDGISEHVMQLKGVVDAYAAGDIAKSYTEQDKAFMHMGMLADTLAGAIAKQFPEKFSDAGSNLTASHSN